MNIQNFSVNDGEGIRTSIFLAGCPLRCKWCSNPEGQTLENPMTQRLSVEEVVGAVHKQSIFYRFSGGGVTFSGGEATIQLDFLKALTDIFYDEGLDLALETCGFFDFEKVKPVLSKMNLIFMDLKVLDSKNHEYFTGKDNSLILSNLEKTAELCRCLNIKFVIRIPLIEGVNADKENLEKSFAFISKKIPSPDVEILSYHKFGEAKYKKLNMTLPSEKFSIPSSEKIRKVKKLAESYGIRIEEYK